MRGYVVVIGIVLLAVLAIVWMGYAPKAVAPGGGQACTMEAKLCPDGSAVGRTGPNCEFAACPEPTTVTTTTSSGMTTLAIGASATVSGTTIGVLELVEDSRCPIDVVCIQAGTVRVRTSIDSYNKDFTFTLSEGQVVGNATITLVSVIPAQKRSTQTVKPSDYRFTFTVAPKAITSGVRGTVMLGPTCPVERDPPDPQCADKGYATTITARHVGSSAIVTTGESDASGAFELALSPGSYTLMASGGAVLPRCSATSVTVTAGRYATTTISCDTGIR